MISPSELQILILALAMTPLMTWMYRSIDLPQKHWLAAAIIAMVGAYTATVLEGFFAPALLDTAEHGLYAVAGACFVVVAFGIASRARDASGGDE